MIKLPKHLHLLLSRDIRSKLVVSSEAGTVYVSLNDELVLMLTPAAAEELVTCLDSHSRIARSLSAAP